MQSVKPGGNNHPERLPLGILTAKADARVRRRRRRVRTASSAREEIDQVCTSTEVGMRGLSLDRNHLATAMETAQRSPLGVASN